MTFSESGTKYTQHWPSLSSPDWWLNQGYLLTTGNAKSSWRWIPGQTILSTHASVLGGFLGYLFLVFTIQFLMKFKKTPFKLVFITQAHNLFLSLASAFLFLGFLEQVIPVISKNGFVWSFCDEHSYTQPLEYLYYLNYLFKWVEFIDTLLLVLKKKPLMFLHVYHHSLTMVLCYSQLLGRTSVSWPICTINLFVHIIMYYYYYLASIGIRPWWKKHVTTLQIVQFVIDLGLVVFSQYTNMAYHSYPDWPHMGNCRGTKNAAFIGTVLLSSYLILFIQFFANTYKKAPGAKTSIAKKTQ